MVDVQHDLGRSLDILLEKLLQYMNDEFHRRVIVVQYQDAVEIRPLCLRLDLGDDGRGRTTRPRGTVLIVAHAGSERDTG